MHGLANVFVLVWFGVWGFLVFVLFGVFLLLFFVLFCFLVYNRNQRERPCPILLQKTVVSELRDGVEEGDDTRQNG